MTKLSSSILVLLLLMAPYADAATAKIKGEVTQTLVADDGRWGGCMARLSERLADHGLDCPGTWVTFNCADKDAPGSDPDGDRSDSAARDMAFRMFDSAQMAFALGKPVLVEVTDLKKRNGHCSARRIDVLRGAAASAAASDLPRL